jgi:hypothetical protein
LHPKVAPVKSSGTKVGPTNVLPRSTAHFIVEVFLGLLVAWRVKLEMNRGPTTTKVEVTRLADMDHCSRDLRENEMGNVPEETPSSPNPLDVHP